MKTTFIVVGLAILPFAGCTSKPATPSVNQQAALNGTLPYNPFQWKIITSSLNRRDSTMSTLYGNDIAVKYARSNPDHNYPTGAVLSLVTWAQRDDPHWFGAKIPASVKSVEFLTVAASPNQPAYTYENYQGSPLRKINLSDTSAVNARVDHLLSRRAAVMP
ncbi:cytochrome P460 [Edaphobacter aggregans]|uniref:Cytochrome P460 n=1 Tax=Edaphobacter aggregans TaxID=570835 RepID=A0A428MJW6_9BACT|nr:cytochrome P460 family protein [Edaphobacter aggregans]RSL17208.1 cytochrome P460 [Edaphobacter aggregans]